MGSRVVDGTPARIAVIHRPYRLDVPAAMDRIRLLRMSQALARRGHTVDIARDIPAPRGLGPRVREVPVRSIDWAAYDMVKALFHHGFDSLADAGGADHPFIVTKLGSVVGSTQTPGVHFYGHMREELFEMQLAIARRSRYVTILTEASAALWRREHGDRPPILMVPTGVDARLPPGGPDPYRAAGIPGPIVLFAGNIYDATTQPEVNRVWQDRLNRLGRAVRRRGLTLVAMGYGETDRLDPALVTHVGTVDARRYWDWQRHASVGICFASGPVQDNEGSKIYYYLRSALPVVCERPVPNASLIEETGCGAIVEMDDVDAMADTAADLAAHPPDLRGLPARMVREHSWDTRAALYAPVIAEAVAERRAASMRRAS